MQTRTHKLADVASVFNGKTPSRKEQRTKGFPVLKIKDVNEDGQFVGGFDSFVDEEFAEQFSNKFVRVGDTLVLNAAHSASYVGSKVYFAEPAVVGSLPTGEWLLIRPDAHKAVPEYVHYWVQSEPTRRRITDLVKGIHLYPKDVARLRISLPPLPEQKRITAILAKADRLRRLRRTARDLSDTYLQSVFLEMFGGESKTEYVTIQELMRRKVILKMQDGNHGEAYPRRSDFVSQGIPFLTATNVIDDQVFLDSAPRITPEKASQLRIGWIEPNDVLLSHNATVGRVGIVPQFTGKVVIGTSLTYYRLNHEVLTPAYFAQVLRSRPFQGQMEQIMKQTTRNQVPITRQRELLIPEPPPLSLQQQFAHIVHKFERLRAQQREAERQAGHLFQTLLYRVFRGEL